MKWTRDRKESASFATCRCGHHHYRIRGEWLTSYRQQSEVSWKVRERFYYVLWVSLNWETWTELTASTRLIDAKFDAEGHCMVNAPTAKENNHETAVQAVGSRTGNSTRDTV